MEYKVQEYKSTVGKHPPKVKEYMYKPYNAKIKEYIIHDIKQEPVEYQTKDRMPTQPVTTSHNEYVPPWTKGKEKKVKKIKAVMKFKKKTNDPPLLPGTSSVNCVKRMVHKFSLQN